MPAALKIPCPQCGSKATRIASTDTVYVGLKNRDVQGLKRRIECRECGGVADKVEAIVVRRKGAARLTRRPSWTRSGTTSRHAE